MKFSALCKFGWAFLIGTSVFSVLFNGFETGPVYITLSIGVFLFFSPYCYYLIRTGIWNQKEDRYLLRPIPIIGLVIHVLLMVVMLFYGFGFFQSETGTSQPFGFMIPMALLGILMAAYDIHKFHEAWKFKKFLSLVGYAHEPVMEGSAQTDQLPYTKQNIEKVTVNTRISFRQYLKLMIYLTIRNGWFIYISIIGIVMLGGSIILYSENAFSFTDPLSIFRLLFGAFIVLIMPCSVYFSAKKNFESNRRIGENILYEFEADEMKMTGESFITLRKWTQTYKIEELKNWFLIYESKNVANLVSKETMSGAEIDRLRILFLNINDPDVKVKVNPA